MAYRWILFDADNTLFDFDRAAAEALQTTVEAHGQSFADEHLPTYIEINARYWHRLERGEIDQNGLRVARFEEFLTEIGMVELDAAAFSAEYETNLGRGTHLLAGAEEAVAAVAPHASMMLITNGLRNVQRPRLTNAPIARYFADFVISEEVGAAKPDRRIFEIAFERMGSPDRADVLIVGDSLSSDIQGGSDFGIDTCWFNPAGRPKDRDVRVTHEARTLAEVAAVCLPVD